MMVCTKNAAVNQADKKTMFGVLNLKNVRLLTFAVILLK